MNRKQHQVIGVTVGVGITLWQHCIQLEHDPNAPFPVGKLLTNMAVGYVGASIPDFLEPATSPNHRAFFHSVTAAAILGRVAFGSESEQLGEFERNLLRSLAWQYGVHLLADSTTPKGIPLLHPKLF